MQDFEKLAAFYLGRRYDRDTSETTAETILYDAKDLTTHAVCVGMTGSGKTGLCVSLLEEAALDGIPALVIDPKGDMGNLMLTFPDLAQEDFLPWVDEGEAKRKGQTSEEFAQSTAELWKKGLAGWGQDGERIQRLRDAAEVAIYTPGSSAGLPLSVLRSFDAPSKTIREDAEALGDRIQGAVSGLLALLGIDADPIQSRESILLANILQHAWTANRSLSLAALIGEIQKPPFEKLGVMDLESFFPAKERFGLAMSLNNLLASPGFATWMEGEPFDIGRLLYTEKGKPRIAILNIAHLSESERMFFVTLALNEMVAWTRSQSGTSSLRAILYMDEIFGYFPPTKEPPSKKPMLTMLKQARAFGVGVVLATQNPVDLDYKGLSNTGTWFIGRLQTERDKLRVLDGLEGAMTGGGKQFDRAELDAMLSGLGKRVFLMNNVHEEAPVLFHTRWAMSYLRGPFTREHIKRLVEPLRQAPNAEEQAPAERSAASEPVPAPPTVSAAPVLPPEVRQRYLEVEDDLEPGDGDEERLVYRPMLHSTCKLHFANARAKIDLWREHEFLVSLGDEDIDWESARLLPEGEDVDTDKRPAAEAQYADLPAKATRAKSYGAWSKKIRDWNYQNQAIVLWKSKEFRLLSEVGTSEREFRAQVAQAAKEKRDATLEKLRKKFTPKIERLNEKVRKAEQKIEKEEEQLAEKKKGSLLSIGTTLLGALFSKKVASSTNARSAGTAMRSASRVSKEKGDVARAHEDLAEYRQDLKDLNTEFEAEIEALEVAPSPQDVELDEVVVRPRKADIAVADPILTWAPWVVDSTGIAKPAFE